MAGTITKPPQAPSLPGLYDPSVRDLVRESLEHVWSVTFRDQAGDAIPLDVIDAQVTLDRSWWPYVQGSVTAIIPPDQATLDRLDPRRIVTAELSAGYVLPGGVRDEHPLAKLYLSGRSVTRPDNLIQLSVQGQEYLLARATSPTFPAAADPTFMIADAVQATPTQEVRTAVGFMLAEAGSIVANIGTNVGWDYENASNLTGWSGAKVSPTQDERYGADVHFAGAYMVDVARDIANLTGCWLRCDETGLWRCTAAADSPQFAKFPRSEAVLAVGAGGTVIESDTSFDRDGEWANLCITHHTWTDDATGNGRFGFARVTSGPFMVTRVGVVARSLEFAERGYVTQAVADNRAAYNLRHMLNRGRVIGLGAVAMYWLRPEMGVTVQLPLGPQEQHLIEAVTYTLGQGRMSLRTYQPDTVSTITLGGA